MHAIVILLPSAPTYLSEIGFGFYHNKIQKKRKRLKTIDEEVRAALTTITPNLDRLNTFSEIYFV